MIADVIGAGGSGMSRPCSYNEASNYVDITTNNLRCCVGSNPAPKEYRFMGLVVVDTSVAIRNRG